MGNKRKGLRAARKRIIKQHHSRQRSEIRNVKNIENGTVNFRRVSKRNNGIYFTQTEFNRGKRKTTRRNYDRQLKFENNNNFIFPLGFFIQENLLE